MVCDPNKIGLAIGFHDSVAPRPSAPAIVVKNDILAFGALRAASDLGLHVPDDVSVMGYDDISAAIYCTPQLSTVNRPKYDLGRESALMLIENILNKEATGTKHQLLPASIVIRNSTAPPYNL